jgi:two-component system, chemotaxis family, chemotaxis protein CheY
MAQVLIVDDSVTMRQMVAFTLSNAGHQVHEASSAEEAMRWVAQRTPDLIITDINMPGISGIELVKQLRQIAELKTKPILVLTTEHQLELKAQGRAAGATGWIVKPFNPDALLKVLPRVLG